METKFLDKKIKTKGLKKFIGTTTKDGVTKYCYSIYTRDEVNNAKVAFENGTFESDVSPSLVGIPKTKNKCTVYIHTHGPVMDFKTPKGYIYSSTELLDEKQLLLADDFCFEHKKSYGETNTLYYLWKNRDILPEYVGLAHYRRFFKNFIDGLDYAPAIVDKYGAIVAKPYIHTRVKNNYEAMCGHNKYDIDLISYVIARKYPDYIEDWRNVQLAGYHISKNMFITKKETFIEMCDFVFGVLSKYDEIQGFKTDDDLKRYVDRLVENGTIPKDRQNREYRLQGYWAEWLTQCFWEHKFKNLYKADMLMYGRPLIEQSKDKLVVSLTSYPPRIETCAKTLESIGESANGVNCTKLFTLSLDEFPNRTKDLPKGTLDMINKYDFHLVWDKGNISSKKKIMPPYKFFHDYPILVLDDDKIYPKHVVPMFKTDNEKYPNDIIVGISFFKYEIKDNGKIECKWNNPQNGFNPHFEPYQELTTEKAANGCNGTVYPANCFKDERFLNRKLAEYVSPTADEDWCHFFAMLSGIKQRMCSIPNLDSKNNNSNNKEALYKRHGPRFYSILATNLSRLLGII